jgi:hypothetical protein
MQKFGIECKVNEWRLSIHSSKGSLKVVLHNGNNCTSLPVGHSLHLKKMLKTQTPSLGNWTEIDDLSYETGL